MKPKCVLHKTDRFEIHRNQFSFKLLYCIHDAVSQNVRCVWIEKDKAPANRTSVSPKFHLLGLASWVPYGNPDPQAMIFENASKGTHTT